MRLTVGWASNFKFGECGLNKELIHFGVKLYNRLG